MEGMEAGLGGGGNNILGLIVALAPVAVSIGEKIISYFTNKDEQENKEQANNEVNKELENKINDLNNQKKFFEEQNKKNEERIESLKKNVRTKYGRNEKKRVRKRKAIIRKRTTRKRKANTRNRETKRSH